jgi:hypothetical protein
MRRKHHWSLVNMNILFALALLSPTLFTCSEAFLARLGATASRSLASTRMQATASGNALIFDCDGVSLASKLFGVFMFTLYRTVSAVLILCVGYFLPCSFRCLPILSVGNFGGEAGILVVVAHPRLIHEQARFFFLIRNPLYRLFHQSEGLHRDAYNNAFEEFGIDYRWTPEYYDELQNKIGGGKPKMRYYFGEYGWPTSKMGPPPASDQSKDELIDALQDRKTDIYKELIASGTVPVRPGFVRVVKEAKVFFATFF